MYPVSQRLPLGIAASAAVAAPLLEVATGQAAALAGLALVPGALAWACARLARVRRELQQTLPLDLASFAVRDAYAELGELADDSASSLAIEPRASGYLRVWLERATPEEAARYTAALDEVVGSVAFPRYLVSRLVPGRRHPLGALLRSMTFRPPFDQVWGPVPADLGRRKERAEAFALAWRRWLGPSELRFTQRSEAGREALAAASAQAPDYETRTRRVWL
jgi:hypothetical protein